MLSTLAAIPLVREEIAAALLFVSLFQTFRRKFEF